MLIMGAFVFSFFSQVGDDSKCLVIGMSPQTWHMFWPTLTGATLK